MLFLLFKTEINVTITGTSPHKKYNAVLNVSALEVPNSLIAIRNAKPGKPKTIALIYTIVESPSAEPITPSKRKNISKAENHATITVIIKDSNTLFGCSLSFTPTADKIIAIMPAASIVHHGSAPDAIKP